MTFAVALASFTISLGSVTAPNVRGGTLTLPIAGRPTCLLFVGVHCPIANRMAPELKRIVRDSPEVSFCFVYAEKGIGLKEAAKHADEFGFRGQCVLDRGFAVARFAKATVTPEAALFDRKGNLFYRGRINDLYTEHNVPRSTPSKNDLRDAIKALSRGKAPEADYIAPIGCPIPF